MSTNCSNTGCEERGKSKCAACGQVSYCGQTCQKAHWNAHKAACKSFRQKQQDATTAPSSGVVYNTSATSLISNQQQQQPQQTIQVDQAVAQKLHQIKLQTQTAFQSGNFEGSTKLGFLALEVSKELPEPYQAIESIQILLNLTTAYLQMSKFIEADTQSMACVNLAEKFKISRPNHPQPIDMLSAALTTRAFVLLNMTKLDEAEKIALRSSQLATGIFPPLDIRLFKSLRCLGLIYARKENLEEAESYLRKAFEVASTNGPINTDAQTSADELMQVIGRLRGQNEVEAFAKKYYLAVEEACPDPMHPQLGEVAAKYASLLATSGKEHEAEKLLTKSLKIREKTFGVTSIQVAMTLMGLANIREIYGDVSEETEGLLKRALDIFKTLSGGSDDSQISTHILNCISFIRRVKTKREGHGDNTIKAEDVDEDVDDVVVVKGKSSNGSVASTNKVTSTATATSTTTKPKSRVNEPYENPTRHLDPSDGHGRMRVAGQLFESAQYSKAERVLLEAYDIFLQQKGPADSSTQTARQNLEIVRQNSLNQLWHEILLEEKEKSLTRSMQTLSLEDMLNGKTTSSTTTTSAATTPSAVPFVPEAVNGTAESVGTTTSDWNSVNPSIWKVEEKPQSSCIIN